MKIMVTGANGFVGKNLIENIKARTDCEVYPVTRETSDDQLRQWCKDTDFVYNLAGVNRPKDNSEFMKGNVGFGEKLLSYLNEADNNCPIMLSSSIQASLEGRFANSEYGKSKLAAEEMFKNSGRDVMIYRFPGLFGKWCKPNYNSVVATFCYNMANDLPIQINDSNTELELAYIDDVVDALMDRRYDFPRYNVTLGEIVNYLEKFKKQPETLMLPEIPNGSFEKKLYSTYLSYLPKEKVSFPLKMNTDNRGSFTELLKTEKCGQFSVNISKPGITKGQHWHNTKWEFFIVVSGKGRIEERKIGTDEILSFDVSGEKIEAVHMLPGYTHNIINLSETEDLVTLMWANETLDKERPDTFREIV